MKVQLDETKEKLKQSQEDYSAATFTRERYAFLAVVARLILSLSKNGRQLMSRIRMLQRENEGLGLQLETGKIHKLEVELEVCKGINSSNLDSDPFSHLETISFLNECKAEDTELIEHCLKERDQQFESETL
jgi:hypothetical protein